MEPSQSGSSYTLAQVRAAQKHRDGIFSKLITRRLSALATWALLRVFPGIQPSTVTFLSLALAFVAAGLFLQSDYAYRVIGVLVLQLSFVFDCSDGEIARLTGRKTKFGAFFDSCSDRLKETLLFSVLAYHLYAESADTQFLLIGGAAAIGMLLVGYLREAKRSFWQGQADAEFSLTKTMYLGTVDLTIFSISFAVLAGYEEWLLWLFAVASVPMLIKQFLSAVRQPD